MEFYELTLTLDDQNVTDEQLDEVRESLNKIIEGNLNELAEGEFQRPFYQSGGKLILAERMWGLERPMLDDILTLSESFPAVEFALVKTWGLSSFNSLELLENYWKGVFQDGRTIDTFKPKAIEWKSETERNWYVDDED